MFDLTGRTAVVTGAARGIGSAYAHALAAHGAAVCLLDLGDAQPVASAIWSEGGMAVARQCDITDRDAVRAAFMETRDRFESIDVLVNNAALFADLSPQPFSAIPDEEWDAVLRVNVRGVATCSAAAVDHFKGGGGGKIINVASATVFKGVPMLAHYVASKGAVVALTRALARELGPDNITVNAIAPGLTETEALVDNPTWNDAMWTANVASRCLQRPQRPEDLVGTLLFLASSASDFLTGQTIVVDGGSVTH